MTVSGSKTSESDFPFSLPTSNTGSWFSHNNSLFFKSFHHKLAIEWSASLLLIICGAWYLFRMFIKHDPIKRFRALCKYFTVCLPFFRQVRGAVIYHIMLVLFPILKVIYTSESLNLQTGCSHVLSCGGVWGMGGFLTCALAVHLSLPALWQTNETPVVPLPHPHGRMLLLSVTWRSSSTCKSAAVPSALKGTCCLRTKEMFKGREFYQELTVHLMWHWWQFVNIQQFSAT